MIRRIAPMLIALTLFAAACGDDGGAVVTTSTAATTTTAAGTTTTVALTTTTAATTTTTEPATTTVGPLEDPILFLPDGLSVVSFGMSPEDTIATMTLFLGPPIDDTGWVDAFDNFGVCPGPITRQVAWGGLYLMFTDPGPFAGGGAQFFSYFYVAGAPGPTPGPPQSVDAGTTVDEVLAIWPTAVISPADEFFAANFRVDLGGGHQLYGLLTGTTATDTVTEVYGGYGCGE